jgi:hypothetical protein
MKDWDRFFVEEGAGDSAGISNLHIPLTFTILKTYHARFFQAWASNEPRPKARRPDGVEREQLVSDVMNYALRDWSNNYEGVAGEVDRWIWNWAAYGAGTLKSRWDTNYERFRDVIEVPVQTVRHMVGPEGEEVAVPHSELREEEQVLTEKIFEGPALEFVPEDDLVIIGGDGDPQHADMVGHQCWFTASDLWSLVDQKIFDRDAVVEVVEAGDDPKSTEPAGGAQKDAQRQIGGEASLDVPFDHDRYRIIEAYVKYDVDESGIGSEIVAWIHPRTGNLLKATYLRRVHRDGIRPFFRAEFYRREGSKNPIGLVEILYPLAKEMDAIHNMRIDSGVIASMPFGFYKATSSLEPEVIRYEPGALIPVDDPQNDVFFPNLGNRTLFGMQEEQALQVIVERLTGISDLNLGVQSGKQGAARTAAGVHKLSGESNANLDIHLRRLYNSWRKYLRHLNRMLQKRIPPGLSFKITGQDGQDYWAYVRDKQDIAGDFEFEIDPSSADSNPAVREQRASETLALVLNPLAIQMGVVTPLHIFEAMKTKLQSSGIKDWARYIQRPPMMQHSLSPQEEVNRLLRGQDVQIMPEGDHQGFIDYFEFITGSPELLEQFAEQDIVKVASQAQGHRQMAQALEQQAAQARNIQQMQQNSAQAAFAPPQAGGSQGGMF